MHETIKKTLESSTLPKPYFIFVVMLHKAECGFNNFIPAIHYFAHTFNFERFIHAWGVAEDEASGLRSDLSSLPTLLNATWLNPIRRPGAVRHLSFMHDFT